MTARKVRGLEDREAQERKALLRDVRSPVHQLLDAAQKWHSADLLQLFGAGVCLLAFSYWCYAILWAWGSSFFCCAAFV